MWLLAVYLSLNNTKKALLLYIVIVFAKLCISDFNEERHFQKHNHTQLYKFDMDDSRAGEFRNVLVDLGIQIKVVTT